MLKFKPAPGWILIRVIDKETTGNLITTSKKDETKAVKGEVVATGPTAITEFNAIIKCPVKIGDIVMVNHYGPEDWLFNYAPHKIVHFKEILGVLEEEIAN